MFLEFLIKAGLLLCLPFLSLQESYTPHEIVFNYNNTYKYNVSYEVAVDRNTEYIMEFAGDQVLYETPARVTVASNFANKTYPLFITARQQKGVFSWQLPVVVASSSGSIHQFSNISRTLCPHNNMFAQGEDSCDTPVTNTPIIHLTSSSPDPIKVTIKVETVQDFYIKLDRLTNVSSAPSQPQYYFYPFDQGAASGLVAQGVRRKQLCREQLDDQEQTILDRYYEMANLYKTTGWLSRPKSVILLIESDDDLCAVVSIQNFSCPVFDNERDILYDGYYLTMTRRGGITLTQDTFPIGFYIVFIVKTSDADCTGQAAPGGANGTTSILHYFGWEQARDTLAVNTNDGRVKTFSFRVISTISYQEYLVGAGAALAFFLAFYVAFLVALCVQTRRRTRDRLTEEGTSAPAALAPDVVTNAIRRRTRDTSAGHGDATSASLSSPSDTESSSSETEEVQDRDWHRLSGKLCLANLSRCRSRVLQARSRLYLWNVLTVAVFYTLPVVQLVVTYQRLLNQSGNQDLCYFNFLCAHPLLVVSDFNHVYSNLGYILLGFLFLARVRRRHKEHQEKTEQEKQLGIPQHFGLLYAMGVALVSEGLLSAAYHVCPNSMNFQFDTSFMYVTSVLCMVKIYQARHPDINARAHATFGVLALIIFIGLVGVLNANLYFWVAFTALHLVTCQVLTFQIYYLGRFKIDGGTLYRACIMLSRGGRAALTPTHIGRGAMLLAANLANWALAVYGVTQHSRDFASHLLLVLMSNLFLYTLFYIIMKLLHRESIRWISWVYIALTYTVWFSSSYFYLDQSTNWALTPAQSRRHNRVCSLLQLYDSHDVWHFASATAMFFSFNMYLTIDDNLATVSRNDIMVF